MTTATYIAVRADHENNAEEWWDALRQQYPRFADTFMRHDVAVIRSELWDVLAALPGFSDGPEYAPTALLDCGSEGDQWSAAVAETHQVFEELE